MPRHLIPRVLLALVLAVAGAGCSGDDGDADGGDAVTTTALTTPGATAPPQPAPWSSGPPEIGSAAGADDGVVVVGDSLVQYSDVDALAAEVSAATGRASTVLGAAGASWVNFTRPGLQNANLYLWDHAEQADARVTVGALATNDARIITQHPDDYSGPEQSEVMTEAVTRTLETSQCVVLVTVEGRDDVDGMSRAATGAVNANMVALAGTDPERVRVADWEAHAAAHPDWFSPGDVHLTVAGYTAYRSFIADAVRTALGDGC